VPLQCMTFAVIVPSAACRAGFRPLAPPRHHNRPPIRKENQTRVRPTIPQHEVQLAQLKNDREMGNAGILVLPISFLYSGAVSGMTRKNIWVFDRVSIMAEAVWDEVAG